MEAADGCRDRCLVVVLPFCLCHLLIAKANQKCTSRTTKHWMWLSLLSLQNPFLLATFLLKVGSHPCGHALNHNIIAALQVNYSKGILRVTGGDAQQNAHVNVAETEE